jgi:hypothetical protein
VTCKHIATASNRTWASCSVFLLNWHLLYNHKTQQHPSYATSTDPKKSYRRICCLSLGM